jgi:hypothetical protein
MLQLGRHVQLDLRRCCANMPVCPAAWTVLLWMTCRSAVQAVL